MLFFMDMPSETIGSGWMDGRWMMGTTSVLSYGRTTTALNGTALTGIILTVNFTRMMLP